MPLFQPTVLKKYLAELDKDKLSVAWENFSNHFHNPEIQANIHAAKEEQYQEGFLRELFVSVLGYTLNPQPNFNLTTEYKNEKDSKKADGAIIVEGSIRAVIELKGTDTTDLSKIEKQAFGYLNNHKGCTYVITSNFEKLRFYIEDAIDFEEFNLFTLTRDQFALLFLCLHKDNILALLPLTIKQLSVAQEDNVTKKLYADYSLFRNNIFQNLVFLNSQYNKLDLFKKTQKLLDRFLFILFAEDRLLLPPNFIRKITEDWKQLQKLRMPQALYSRFQLYFSDLLNGNAAEDIFAYNGGLFMPDEVLDNILIDDNLLLEGVLSLSKYDYSTEVDVNILGHIFEHSLNEIENLQASLEATEVDKTKTRRKKEGVFYTPRYITKYIVENTVGTLCGEKKTELAIIEEEYSASKNKPNKKALLQKLDDYRTWLLGVTICDPACGSGAFLNAAFEFLIEEHHIIDELTNKLMGGALEFRWTPNDILEKNLFGVDINEEAVEIARLSLWLRTAQKGRKLSNLSQNIKVGNSLIDDLDVAGDKAYKWGEEFKEVLDKGGFDVVIGNPPYVRQELLGLKSKDFFSRKFPNVFNGIADLYVYFFEQSLTILKTEGRLGFITPNKWLERKYGFQLRAFLKPLNIVSIINYGELKIFEDAATEPAIIIIKNEKSDSLINYSSITSLDIAQKLNYSLIGFDKVHLDADIWRFTSSLSHSILSKFKDSEVTLNDYTQNGIYRGILTGLNKAFIINSDIKNELVSRDPKSIEVLKKMVEGDDLNKWSLNYSGRYLVATGYDNLIEDSYPAIFEYLQVFKSELIKRQDKGVNYWNLRSCDYYDKFSQPKIIYYHTAREHRFYLDNEGYYISANCYIIANADTYLQCILNSSLFGFIKKYMFPAFGDAENGGRVRLDANKMVKLPIKVVNSELKNKFQQKADVMHFKSQEFQNIHIGLINFLKSKYGTPKIPKGLSNWPSLSFQQFLKTLDKISIRLSLVEQREWLQYFETEKEKALAIQAVINQTEAEIDDMVYALYNLTEVEVAIVEGT